MMDEHSRYLGVLGLLSNCSIYVPEELRESIESAMTDAVAANSHLQWRRVLNRIEIDVTLASAVAATKAAAIKLLTKGSLAEDVLIRKIESLVEDAYMVHNVLAEMVEKDRTLVWNLPKGVKEGSKESAEVPLIYTLVKRNKEMANL